MDVGRKEREGDTIRTSRADRTDRAPNGMAHTGRILVGTAGAAQQMQVLTAHKDVHVTFTNGTSLPVAECGAAKMTRWYEIVRQNAIRPITDRTATPLFLLESALGTLPLTETLEAEMISTSKTWPHTSRFLSHSTFLARRVLITMTRLTPLNCTAAKPERGRLG